jgi:hypothetical protein
MTNGALLAAELARNSVSSVAIPNSKHRIQEWHMNLKQHGIDSKAMLNLLAAGVQEMSEEIMALEEERRKKAETGGMEVSRKL